MRKIPGVLAATMVLSAWVAGAETFNRDWATPTRQAAIWQDLFPATEAASQDRATRIAWLGEVPGVGAAPGAPTLAASVAVDTAQAPATADQAGSPRPKAFEYSEAYNKRRKIHFYASFATIPLFVTQYVLGDKLYDGSSGSTKSAHSATAVAIEALFAVNTVTGVWNMWEARKDPNGRAKKLTHGIMMLGADVGFVATGLLAPDNEDGQGDKSTHRNVAIASMAVATASYLIMLIGR